MFRNAIKKTREKKANNVKKLNKRRGGFTLVEIMIVVAIIALLAAIAVPGFLRARKRSQASRILNDLRMIDSAVDQYAIETNRKPGIRWRSADWTNYLKKGSLLYNTGNSLLGSAYGAQTVDTIPRSQRATTPSCRTLPAPVSGRLTVRKESDDSFSCHSREAGVAGNEL